MRTEIKHLAEARVGTRLDAKWQLDALLGWGGSAAVYAATHRNGKRAALKILHAHCLRDHILVSRFVREGYLANKIQHPGVVSVLDDNVAADGSVYLVMELLEGESLERRSRGLEPPLSVSGVLRVADDLLDVLVTAHGVGLVHRDIKPGNIFVTNVGQLKVLDFGIARLSEPAAEGATLTGTMMGTPAFMPPEQARARWQDVDARSDIWAVGATMMTLLLGRRPRSADTANEELLLAMTEPMPSLGKLAPEAPPELVLLIDKALAFDRSHRFQSAREMQQAVRKLRQVGDARESATIQIDPRSFEGDTIASAQPLGTTGTLVATGTTGQPAIGTSWPNGAPSTAPGYAPASAPPRLDGHARSDSGHSKPGFVSGHSNPPHDGRVSGGPFGYASSPPASPSAPVPMPSQERIDGGPSLTTHSAVLHSARPPGSGGRAIAIVLGIVLCGGLLGGGLYFRNRARARAAAASETRGEAPADTAPPVFPPPVAASGAAVTGVTGAPIEAPPNAPDEPGEAPPHDVAPPPTSRAAPERSGAHPAPSDSSRGGRRDPKKPPTAGSADPNKFFDSRF